jgi:SAM-dependent MidA family methyltransferase
VIERLDAFMARAGAAYYEAADPYADFTTAPEISQAFGEVLGLWAAVVWQMLGRPTPVLLAEAGPGRGTLMADALRAIGQAAPDFGAALCLHLIETSQRLRAIQAARLPPALWHDQAQMLPDGPLLLLANEFLDALPIRQFIRGASGWTERYVQDGRPVDRPAPRPTKGSGAAEGTVIELCEAGLALADWLGARVTMQGGAALFLDYGAAEPATGDSLQALQQGRPADPFVAPGTADLTAHVDFSAIAAAAREAGAAVHGPIPQGLFLARIGLFQRTDRAGPRPPAGAGTRAH